MKISILESFDGPIYFIGNNQPYSLAPRIEKEKVNYTAKVLLVSFQNWYNKHKKGERI